MPEGLAHAEPTSITADPLVKALVVDVETQSLLELPKVGTHRYAAATFCEVDAARELALFGERVHHYYRNGDESAANLLSVQAAHLSQCQCQSSFRRQRWMTASED